MSTVTVEGKVVSDEDVSLLPLELYKKQPLLSDVQLLNDSNRNLSTRSRKDPFPDRGR